MISINNVAVTLSSVSPIFLAQNIYLYSPSEYLEGKTEVALVRNGILYPNAVVSYEKYSDDSSLIASCFKVFENSIHLLKWECLPTKIQNKVCWIKRSSVAYGIDISPKKPFSCRIPLHYKKKERIIDCEGEQKIHQAVQSLVQIASLYSCILPFFLSQSGEIAFRSVIPESVFSVHFEKEARRGMVLLQQAIDSNTISQSDAEHLCEICNKAVIRLNKYAREQRGLHTFSLQKLFSKGSLNTLAVHEPLLWKHISRYIHSDEIYDERILNTFLTVKHTYFHLHCGFLPDQQLFQRVIAPFLDTLDIAEIEKNGEKREQYRVAFQYCYHISLCDWMNTRSIQWDFSKFQKVIRHFSPSCATLKITSIYPKGFPRITISEADQRVITAFQALYFLLKTYMGKIRSLSLIHFHPLQLAFALREKGPLQMLFSPKNPYPLQSLEIHKTYLTDSSLEKVCLQGLTKLILVNTAVTGSFLLNQSFHQVKVLAVPLNICLNEKKVAAAFQNMNKLESLSIMSTPLRGAFITHDVCQRLYFLDISGCPNFQFPSSFKQYPQLTVIQDINNSPSLEKIVSRKEIVNSKGRLFLRSRQYQSMIQRFSELKISCLNDEK